MQDLSLHILDVVENSVRAGALLVHITIVEDVKADEVRVTIADDGKGMRGDLAERVTDPFFSTKEGHSVGLGLPLLAQACRETGGDIHVDSAEGRGTVIDAVLVYSHPDRRPLGDIEQTLKVLITANPDIDFAFRYSADGEEVVFDTRKSV